MNLLLFSRRFSVIFLILSLYAGLSFASDASNKSQQLDIRWDLIAKNAEQFVMPSEAEIQKKIKQLTPSEAITNLAAEQLGPCDCPCASTPITAADFQVGGVGPLVVPYLIVAPGSYKLCEDIAFDPAISNTFAIYILSSNVDLDLGGHTLSLAAGNPQYAGGILIGPGIDNISIVGEDSTVENFALGIFSPGQLNIVAIRDITVQNCGSDLRSFGVFPLDGGIILGSIPTGPVNPAPITDVLISNVRALNNQNFGVIVNLAAENIIIKDSIIDGTFSTVPTYYILGLVVQPTIGQDPIPRLVNVQVIGTTVTNTTCKTISSYAPNDNPFGVLGAIFTGIDNLRVSESTFSNTESAAFNNDPVAPSIRYSVPYIQGGITNYLIENCFFADAKGDPWTAQVNCFHSSANNFTGLQIPNNRTIKNCVATGSLGHIEVVGFDLFYGSNMLVENCQSMNHKSLGNPSTPFNVPSAKGYSFVGSAGITDGDPIKNNTRGNITQVLVKNCSASDIEAEHGPAFGFNYESGIFHKYADAAHTILTPPVRAKNICFIDCVAQRCIAHADTTFLGVTVKAAAAGFMVDNGVFVNVGTAAGNSDFDFSNPQFYKLAENLSNVFVQNCYVSDVRGAGKGKQLSGGIVMLAVKNATITDNNVISTNNAGILLGGAKGAVPNITNGEFRPTKNSLVEGNTCTNNHIGFKNIHKKQNAFVDNISYNNKCNYEDVGGVARNNNRSL